MEVNLAWHLLFWFSTATLHVTSLRDSKGSDRGCKASLGARTPKVR